ncbi:EAL domain-containing protein [Geminicoccus flavidas]|uniref:EAL domain-containing protein n=1 Tax=Geminicoccus flavidas TaxID=2506407 RepID=UPI00135877C8|nr:EAL domain-containing protein [Geminicoccus flavidas]
MVGLFYLLVGLGALVAGTGTLLAIPDPLLRATVAPVAVTLLLLASGGLLLLHRERRLAAPAATASRRPAAPEDDVPHQPAPGPASELPADRHKEPLLVLTEPLGPDPAARRTEPDSAFCTNEPGAAFYTNEPETASPAPGKAPRFGGFSLFRREPQPRDQPAPAGPGRAAEPFPLLQDESEPDSFILPPPSARLLAEVDAGADLLDNADSRTHSVARAVERGELDPVLLPVVSLPQRRRRMVRIRLECRHLDVACNPHDLLPPGPGPLRAALDLELLHAAVKVCARPRPGSENLPVLAWLSITSFMAEEALAALRVLLERHRQGAASLQIFLDQWPTERPGLELIALLRGAGVTIGLELCQRPYLSPDAITGRRIGTVALAAGLVRAAALEAYDTDLIRDLKCLERAGVTVLVTGIGDERTLAEVLDYPIGLGSGRLFGRIG